MLVVEKKAHRHLKKKEINYNVLERGSFSVPEDDTINEQYLVFDDEDTWDFFLNKVNRINPSKAEQFKELSFDYSNKALLIITSEFDYTCSKEIEINKVYRDQGRIYVDFDVSESDNSEEMTSQSYVLFKVIKD